ncbi:hypothetical protein pb186bvf_014055 [Paramecium bursaria]
MNIYIPNYSILVLIFVLLLIIILTVLMMSDEKEESAKIKAWGRMINQYEGIDLSTDERKLLQQTYKNTLHNRHIPKYDNHLSKSRGNKNVSFKQ